MRVQHIEDYYTLHGVAEKLGVSYWQVWRAIRTRQIPTLLLGQTTLVKLAEISAAFGSVEARGRLPDDPTSYRVTGQVCPQCGDNTLVREEGCKKCYSCGYAEC